MALKSSVRKRKAISAVILYALAIIWLIPLIWSISTSFKTNYDISHNTLSLIPKQFTLDRYYELLVENPDNYPLFSWFRNSLFIAITHTVLYLIIASLASYALSILKFKGRDTIFWLLLSSMMIPSVINLVPLVTMMVDFDWFNTFQALIVPGLGGVFGMFIMRQFFLNIPKELIESAQIDGLGKFRIFIHIVVPLSISAFMVAGLFAFLGSWNDYLWPSIILAGSNEHMLTLPVGLAKLEGANNYDYGLSMAASIISIVPVLIVYMFTQERIIEGISHTGIK